MRIGYETAQKDTSLRQDYLFSLRIPYYVSELAYVTKRPESLEDDAPLVDVEDYFFMWYPNRSYGRRTPRPIFTGPRAFEFTEPQFMLSLHEHEFTHAYDAFWGVPVGPGEVIDFSNVGRLRHQILGPVVELRAHMNELEKMIQEGLTGDLNFFGNAYFDALRYAGDLITTAPMNDFEERVRRAYIDISAKRLEKIVSAAESL